MIQIGPILAMGGAGRPNGELDLGKAMMTDVGSARRAISVRAACVPRSADAAGTWYRDIDARVRQQQAVTAAATLFT